MPILSQFVLRLTFGLAAAMTLTSPRKVNSGFFRNHAYVVLGLSVLATMAALADRDHLEVWPPIVSAILSYSCAVVWLYEKPLPGRVLLAAISIVALVGTQLSGHAASQPLTMNDAASDWSEIAVAIWRCDPLTSGLLLGSTIAAMFLGHWYLNSPTMEIAPLRKLLVLMLIAVVGRALVSGLGLVLQWQTIELSGSQSILIALRWLSGLVGTAVLIFMAWRTLRIPNTQSATGILYVAVFSTFLGELTSLLLSRSTAFPV